MNKKRFGRRRLGGKEKNLHRKHLHPGKNLDHVNDHVEVDQSPSKNFHLFLVLCPGLFLFSKGKMGHFFVL